LKQINNTGKEGGLKGFEQARNIYLESEPFMAKGILTNTMKIQRHEAKIYFKDVIKKLYQEK
jgi:long-chain acyl-CoA synthetase